MFSNPIIGSGGDLVRQQIRSPDFVTEISGWQLSQDGTAEFNNAIIRGDLKVGPDDGFQVEITEQVGPPPVGLILLYTHATTEDIPAKLQTFIGNQGLANEFLQLGIISPRHPVPQNATSSIALNSSNADGTSNANISFSGNGIGIATFDGLRARFFQDFRVDGSFLSVGTIIGYVDFTPTWGNIGTGTFSSNSGWYKELGDDLIFFNITSVVNAAGTGASVVNVAIPGITLNRNNHQVFQVQYQRTGTVFEPAVAMSLSSGTPGGTIDRIRIPVGDGGSNVNMIGTDLKAGASQIVIQGFARIDP